MVSFNPSKITSRYNEISQKIDQSTSKINKLTSDLSTKTIKNTKIKSKNEKINKNIKEINASASEIKATCVKLSLSSSPLTPKQSSELKQTLKASITSVTTSKLALQTIQNPKNFPQLEETLNELEDLHSSLVEIYEQLEENQPIPKELVSKFEGEAVSSPKKSLFKSKKTSDLPGSELISKFENSDVTSLDKQEPFIKALLEKVKDEKGEVSQEKIDQLKEGIAKSKTQNKQIKKKAFAILHKFEGEKKVHSQMNSIKAFSGFPKDQVWRLFMNGKLQETRGEYGFENEIGYMGALLEGFDDVLSSLGNPLDADGLEKLHDSTTSEVYQRDGRLMRTGFRRLKEKKFDEMTKDFYDKEIIVTVKLKSNENVSKDGIKQVLEMAVENGRSYDVDNWFIFTPPASKSSGELALLPKTEAECKSRAQNILDEYSSEVKKAKTDDDKLRAMAKCCQNLDQSHVFEDGNIRTFVFLVLNKMLLENGMDPVIMEDPNVFDGFSLDELVQEIKNGQQNFRSYKS